MTEKTLKPNNNSNQTADIRRRPAAAAAPNSFFKTDLRSQTGLVLRHLADLIFKEVNAIVDLHSNDVPSTEQRNYKWYMKSCCVLQAHYDDERDKTVFHNTTPDMRDQRPK